MTNFLDKIIKRSNNSDYVTSGIKNLSNSTPVKKIFDSINRYSSISEIRYVGGCVRKIIKKEKVDDIDLATNLKPHEICEALKNDNINYYETGIEHGTITAIINDYRFEITSLREDVKTDGRHAEVIFSSDWKKDASRRDFTINSIYSDIEGNLFDPFNGKKDLEKGIIKFIGEPDQRIKEDYLRILRYLRFNLIYSANKHDQNTLRQIKKNLVGITNLSKERVLDELKKIVKSKVLTKLSKDKISLEIFESIFPQIKNLNVFSNPNDFVIKKLNQSDFIFLLSVLIIDRSDNTDFFLYKFNLSKKDQKRIKVIDNYYQDQFSTKSLSEHNLNKVFYYYGKQSVIDILSYKLCLMKKIDKKLLNLIDKFDTKILPTMPVNAKMLMEKYNLHEGKTLGDKLKVIEKEWVNNNFQITDKLIAKIISN